MGFQKYAEAQLLHIYSGEELAKRAGSLQFPVNLEPGYMYLRARAISSRVNRNFDGFSKNALIGSDTDDVKRVLGKGFDPNKKYGYSTFNYQPFFVQHDSTNPDAARGVILASRSHDDPWIAEQDPSNPYKDNHWTELLIEMDSDRYPKLAEAIRKNRVNKFSMGTDVEYSTCSICGNEARHPGEYCSHIRNKFANGLGGVYYMVDGHRKLAYEDNHGLQFFEISKVWDPADPTADLLDTAEGQRLPKAASIHWVPRQCSQPTDTLSKVAYLLY